MAYFLFFIYLLLFIILVRWLGKKGMVHIPPALGASAFAFKVLLGCLYGYIFLRYYGGDDTWMYHAQSLEETSFLKRDPLHFLHSLADPTSYTRYMMTTYWQEIEYAFLIKLLAILNVFSGGYYYVNVVLFSMISFWGGYFFYRFFSGLFPGKENLFIIIFFFFVPLIFWTSGIRKDALIFLSAGLFFYGLQQFLREGKKTYLLLTGSALFLLFLNRSFVGLSVLPPAVAWTISHYRGIKPLRTFFFVYAISSIVFFLSSHIGPVDLPGAFVRRQSDFLALKGGSFVHLDKLEPDPMSFLRILPQALNHVFLRPVPGERPGILSWFSGIETYFVLLIFLLSFIRPDKNIRILSSAPMLAILFFAFTNYLFIGYTIPFLGATVRYRIIFESLLLAIAVARIRWKAILPQRIHKLLL